MHKVTDMHEYIERLVECGCSKHTAHNICYGIENTMGESELEVYVSIIESIAYGVPHVD